MDSKLVFSKTPKGEEEIESRHYHLDHRYRLALILVDGHSDVGELHDKAEGLSELATLLETLALQGYIVAGASDWQPTAESGIKKELIDFARLILGKDADKVCKKLSEVEDHHADLIVAIAQCQKLISLTIDEAKGREFAAKCTILLNKRHT
ncbi:MAG TPA: hypothetical protein ENI75_03275 [Mizugakiibacter sp.]|nr:hypothetical protein [Mizugakiibacter sp.]